MGRPATPACPVAGRRRSADHAPRSDFEVGDYAQRSRPPDDHSPEVTHPIESENHAQGVRATSVNKTTPTQAASQPLGDHGPEAVISKETGKTVIDAGSGVDEIQVSQGPNGYIEVEINGGSCDFSGEAAENLVIRGGAGDDTIVVDPPLEERFQLEGGAGEDILVGGPGDDVFVGRVPRRLDENASRYARLRRPSGAPRCSVPRRCRRNAVREEPSSAPGSPRASPPAHE